MDKEQEKNKKVYIRFNSEMGANITMSHTPIGRIPIPREEELKKIERSE